MRLLLLLSSFLILSAGCEEAYPEVVVVNMIREDILVRNISFNGCQWDTVLAFGDSTSPGSCLKGSDRVHFEKFAAAAYVENSEEDSDSTDTEDEIETPLWFNYQTVTTHHVDYGEFHLIVLTYEGMEQDFSVPGPYGH
ncbi:MAG: hypothetical protein JXR95_00310 [Deltaproteobacteria bacterium]|nr:hypothetical protein [Deltaproteobacteria bacterium]